MLVGEYRRGYAVAPVSYKTLHLFQQTVYVTDKFLSRTFQY